MSAEHEAPPPAPRYFCGLDLGQANDFTALAVLKTLGPDAGHDVVHLERWPLGTPYPAIAGKVAELMAHPALHPSRHDRPWLAIDATGVGRAVVDMIAAARPDAYLAAVTITGGREAASSTWEGLGRWCSVPKLDLVAAVQRGLQSDTLRFVPDLEHAETLRRELNDFRVKVTEAANETFNARDGAHDDLVLAVAMPLWFASQLAPAPTLAGAESVPIPLRPRPGSNHPPDRASDIWFRRQRDPDDRPPFLHRGTRR